MTFSMASIAAMNAAVTLGRAMFKTFRLVLLYPVFERRHVAAEAIVRASCE
jgi:hypothetical protein